jgi:hypothetical protein
LQASYGQIWTIVGQYWSNTTNVSTKFFYIRSASSELGVGYSATAAKGSFRASGTKGLSTNASIDYPATGNYIDRFSESRFRYGKFYVSCSQGGTVPPITYYEARPYQWTGGAQVVSPGWTPSFDPDNCAPYLTGSVFTKESTWAITWTDGVNIDAAIGIDLSTRTGYSAGAKIQMGFNRARRVCGTNGPSTGEAAILINA